MLRTPFHLVENEAHNVQSYTSYHGLISEGYAVDGTNGGLVLGPTHEEGGIQMVIRCAGSYVHCGEMEGFEYIFNPGASAYYKTTFAEINNAQRDRVVREDIEVNYKGKKYLLGVLIAPLEELIENMGNVIKKFHFHLVLGFYLGCIN